MDYRHFWEFSHIATEFRPLEWGFMVRPKSTMPRARTSPFHDGPSLPVLNVLVLAHSRRCPLPAALLPHASTTLRVPVVHDMASMEMHLLHNQTDVVVTSVVSEHPDSPTTPEALYRASVDRCIALKEPRSLQCPELPAPQLLWWANGQAALMSLHAQCSPGLQIHVVDTLACVVDALFQARDAILDASVHLDAEDSAHNASVYLNATQSVHNASTSLDAAESAHNASVPLDAAGSVLEASASDLDAPSADLQIPGSDLPAPRAIAPAWPVPPAAASSLRSAVA